MSDQCPSLVEAINILASHFPALVPLPVPDVPARGEWIADWQMARCTAVYTATRVRCEHEFCRRRRA